MIDDLVQKTIKFGRYRKCPDDRHVSGNRRGINTFFFDDGGSACVGITKTSRPVDCICSCLRKPGKKKNIGLIMSPYEAFKTARDLTNMVSVSLLAQENSMNISVETILGYGYTIGVCRRDMECTPLLEQKYPKCPEGKGYHCIGMESNKINLCTNSEFEHDLVEVGLTIGEAQRLLGE